MYMRGGARVIVRSRSPFRLGVDPTYFGLRGHFQTLRAAVDEERPLTHLAAEPGQSENQNWWESGAFRVMF